MGAGGSFHEASEEKQQEIIREFKGVYENEYIPKLKSGQITKENGYLVFKRLIDDYYGSTTPSTAKTATEMILPQVFQPCESEFMIGDVVKAKVDNMMFEGVVVGYADNSKLEIDFGDDVEEVLSSDCSLVLSGIDFEVGDQVACCPNGGTLWFNGVIVEIHRDGTFDIKMDGEDEDDYERGVTIERIRKIRTGRDLVTSRWKRAFNKLQAIKYLTDVKK